MNWFNLPGRGSFSAHLRVILDLRFSPACPYGKNTLVGHNICAVQRKHDTRTVECKIMVYTLKMTVYNTDDLSLPLPIKNNQKYKWISFRWINLVILLLQKAWQVLDKVAVKNASLHISEVRKYSSRSYWWPNRYGNSQLTVCNHVSTHWAVRTFSKELRHLKLKPAWNHTKCMLTVNTFMLFHKLLT